jgi:hypothetical protein
MFTPVVEHMLGLQLCRVMSDINSLALNVGMYLSDEFSDYYFNFPLVTLENVSRIVQSKGYFSCDREFVVSGKFLSSCPHIVSQKVDSIMQTISENSVEDAVNKLTSFFAWENEDIIHDEWVKNNRIVYKESVRRIRPLVDSCSVIEVDADNIFSRIVLKLVDISKSEKCIASIDIMSYAQLETIVNKETAAYCRGIVIVDKPCVDGIPKYVLEEFIARAESCVGDTWSDVIVSLSRYFDIVS